MKYILILFINSSISLIGFTQDAVFIKRNFLFDFAIGVPNAASMYYYKTLKNTSLPIQLGVRAEYMLSDNSGIGIEANYEKFSWEKSYITTVYSAPPLFLPHDTTLFYSQTKTRFLVKYVYHRFQTFNFDLFYGIGLGKSFRKYEHYENHFDEYDDHFPWLVPKHELFYWWSNSPIALRFFIGTHYMLTQNFGILIEVGAGSGSIADVGLTLKL